MGLQHKLFKLCKFYNIYISKILVVYLVIEDLLVPEEQVQLHLLSVVQATGLIVVQQLPVQGACDWSALVTRHEYWPLIGHRNPGTSRRRGPGAGGGSSTGTFGLSHVCLQLYK